MDFDENKLQELLGTFLNDFGATLHAAMVVIGDKLGLYRALAASPMSPRELAERTGTTERYVREWLASQAAGRYVNYNSSDGKYSLSPEQAFALTDENGPVFFPAAFELALAAVKAEPKVAEAYKTGNGVGWHEHDSNLLRGTERFFRPAYAANLLKTWIPADNLNPVGRAFYSAFTLVCTPASLSQEVGLALGAQAGEAQIRKVVSSGGFSHFRRVAQTPFNLVFEARP